MFIVEGCHLATSQGEIMEQSQDRDVSFSLGGGSALKSS
jgi:hypothetical protein